MAEDNEENIPPYDPHKPDTTGEPPEKDAEFGWGASAAEIEGCAMNAIVNWRPWYKMLGERIAMVFGLADPMDMTPIEMDVMPLTVEHNGSGMSNRDYRVPFKQNQPVEVNMALLTIEQAKMIERKRATPYFFMQLLQNVALHCVEHGVEFMDALKIASVPPYRNDFGTKTQDGFGTLASWDYFGSMAGQITPDSLPDPEYIATQQGAPPDTVYTSGYSRFDAGFLAVAFWYRREIFRGVTGDNPHVNGSIKRERIDSLQLDFQKLEDIARSNAWEVAWPVNDSTGTKGFKRVFERTIYDRKKCPGKKGQVALFTSLRYGDSSGLGGTVEWENEEIVHYNAFTPEDQRQYSGALFEWNEGNPADPDAVPPKPKVDPHWRMQIDEYKRDASGKIERDADGQLKLLRPDVIVKRGMPRWMDYLGDADLMVELYEASQRCKRTIVSSELQRRDFTSLTSGYAAAWQPYRRMQKQLDPPEIPGWITTGIVTRPPKDPNPGQTGLLVQWGRHSRVGELFLMPDPAEGDVGGYQLYSVEGIPRNQKFDDGTLGDMGNTGKPITTLDGLTAVGPRVPAGSWEIFIQGFSADEWKTYTGNFFSDGPTTSGWVKWEDLTVDQQNEIKAQFPTSPLGNLTPYAWKKGTNPSFPNQWTNVLPKSKRLGLVVFNAAGPSIVWLIKDARSTGNGFQPWFKYQWHRGAGTAVGTWSKGEKPEAYSQAREDMWNIFGDCGKCLSKTVYPNWPTNFLNPTTTYSIVSSSTTSAPPSSGGTVYGLSSIIHCYNRDAAIESTERAAGQAMDYFGTHTLPLVVGQPDPNQRVIKTAAQVPKPNPLGQFNGSFFLRWSGKLNENNKPDGPQDFFGEWTYPPRIKKILPPDPAMPGVEQFIWEQVYNTPVTSRLPYMRAYLEPGRAEFWSRYQYPFIYSMGLASKQKTTKFAAIAWRFALVPDFPFAQTGKIYPTHVDGGGLKNDAFTEFEGISGSGVEHLPIEKIGKLLPLQLPWPAGDVVTHPGGAGENCLDDPRVTKFREDRAANEEKLKVATPEWATETIYGFVDFSDALEM